MRRLRNLALAAIVLIAALFIGRNLFETSSAPVLGAPAIVGAATSPDSTGAAPAVAGSASGSGTGSEAGSSGLAGGSAAEPTPPRGTPSPKLRELKQILASANDNDPRLDTDFKNMPRDLKHELTATYTELPREKFNDRGTIVFLLGRDFNSPEDVEFLLSVLAEPTCKGLVNCGRPDKGEESPADAITLAYPQLNALRALSKQRDRVKSLGFEPQFKQALDKLRSSDNPTLARLARENS